MANFGDDMSDDIQALLADLAETHEQTSWLLAEAQEQVSRLLVQMAASMELIELQLEADA